MSQNRDVRYNPQNMPPVESTLEVSEEEKEAFPYLFDEKVKLQFVSIGRLYWRSPSTL
jgi:hypothetical protein